MSRSREILIQIRDVLFDLPAFLTAPLYRRHHLRWGATTAETDGRSARRQDLPKSPVHRHESNHDRRTTRGRLAMARPSGLSASRLVQQ